MTAIKETQAGNQLCPFNDFTYCKGARCMAWVYTGRPYEWAMTDDLQDTEDGPRPTGEAPEPPEGDGWRPDGPERPAGYHQSAKLKLPKARSQQWVRDVESTEGVCGRVQNGGYW